MEIVIVGLAALVLLGAAYAGSGRLGDLPPTVTDEFVPRLADKLGPDDLADPALARTLFGYSQTQVDNLLSQARRSWAEDVTPGRAHRG